MRQRILLSIAVLILLAAGADGQVVKRDGGGLDRLVRVDERLTARPVAEPEEEVQGLIDAETRDGWARFRLDAGLDRGFEGNSWAATVDARHGRIDYAEGAGIPFLPGGGNGLARGKEVDLAAVETLTRAFLPRVAPLLGIDSGALRLNRGRSGHPADHLWLIDFDVLRGGLPVEGARVFFRINNGNLIQLGSENLPAAQVSAPAAKLTRERALAILADYIGGLQGSDRLLDVGSLRLLPVATPDSRFAQGFAFGKGRGLALVWQLVLRREGQIGTWRARVDARSGELLEFIDDNSYARVTGGVKALGVAQTRPMPFADLSTGGAANSAGVFPFTGTPVTSTLQGPYVRIVDACGSIAEGSAASGEIGFGTSAGTDCATPGHGGSGNTHAARTQFYYLNRGKEIGRGWLPASTWLSQQLTANVNLAQTCNAYWTGVEVNFFLSGGGCGNTGELEAVSLHELGHGIDAYDGSGYSPDRGTSEAYADIIAALNTHGSCIGPGLYQSGTCGGYGDSCTTCSGFRDIDWAKHASGVPHTVGNFTMNFCPTNSGYAGACGKEGHCESYVASEAVWDLAQRDLPNPGSREAWNVVERLWYLANTTATSAFVCNTGTVPWTSNGCFAGSWWRAMRAVDDDDGNLANGTPHSAALLAAFNRHGLACAADPGAGVSFRGCAQPAAPALTLSPGDNQVTLGWSGSTGVYDVYRNETGCNAAFTKIAGDVSGGSLVDSGVANDSTYYYQVIAQPSGNEACASAPSACQAIALPHANDAQILSQSVPPAMVAGQSYTVSLTVKNTGTRTWSPVGAGCNAYRLAAAYPSWSPIRAELPAPLGPGQEVTLSFAVTAPATAGTYNFQWRMIQECVESFGASSPVVPVTVRAAQAKDAQVLSQSVPAVMVAGQTYPVSVRVKNVGSQAWSPVGPSCNAYRLGVLNNVWSPVRVELPAAVAVGQEVTLSFTVTAPATAGTYGFQWQMVQECVQWLGDPTPNVAVTVRAAQAKDAEVLSQSVPSAMVAGRSYSVSLTVRNSGTQTWNLVGPQCNAYRLGSLNTAWSPTRAELPSTLAPGQQVTLSFQVTAPATPGTYNFQWQMVQECVQWFGDLSPNVAVTVRAAQAKDAQILSQSVPAVMVAGQSYPVSVRVKNVGSQSWSPVGPSCNAYRLGTLNTQWNPIRAELAAALATGQEVTLNFSVTAPAVTGTYDFQWQMIQECVQWFGDLTEKKYVTVTP